MRGARTHRPAPGYHGSFPAPPMRTLHITPLLVALLALGGAGCNPVTSFAEGEVERILQDAFGPADDYDVQIEGLDAGDGTARRVTVAGDRVRPEGAPVLDRVDAVLNGVRFNRDEKTLERADRADLTVSVLPDDLAAYLVASGRVEEAEVSFEPPSGIVLRLRPDLGAIPLPPGATVRVAGTLEGEGARVRLNVESVEAAGIGLGGAAAGLLEDQVNPLIDLSRSGGLEVTDITVEGGALRARAEGPLTDIRFD